MKGNVQEKALQSIAKSKTWLHNVLSCVTLDKLPQLLNEEK